MPRTIIYFVVFAFSLFVMLLVFQVNPVLARTFNNDFETGDLTDWTKTGDGFDFQPTWGDNPTARNRGQPSQHQGDWWLGLYEKYQGPDKGKKAGQFAGAIQGDVPQGTLTSIEFTIVGDKMHFLMAGGNHPWEGDPGPTCVNLVIGGKVVRTAAGKNTETFAREEWEVAEFKGKKAQIVVVDKNSGGWGHPNFDDVHQADKSGKNIPWDVVLAVDSKGKLPVAWGQMKKYY